MKSEAFGSFAKDVSALFRDSGAVQGAEAWRQFAEMFAVKPASSVADVSKTIASLSPQQLNVSQTELQVGTLLQSLPPLERIFSAHGKGAVASDLRSLSEALTPFANFGILQFVDLVGERLKRKDTKKKPDLNSALVDEYLMSLKQTIRDEAAFKLALAALKGDTRMTVAEFKSLAKSLTGGVAKSKAQALSFISRHHEVIMIDKAKAAATGGRTAA